MTDSDVMTERLDHAAIAGAGISTSGALLGGYDWATRPPCPDNYVRLIDVEPVAVVLLAVLAVGLTWRAARSGAWSRWPKRVTVMTLTVSSGLTVLAALPALMCAAMLVQHHGQQLDSDCWTF